MTPVKGAVVTGLVRRPQFEDVIRYRNPKVQIPFRQAWFERNSHHMSQFDGVGNDLEVEGLVEHLREQASEAHAHAAMQHLYRGRGIPYLAQGPGGPPAYIPFGAGEMARQADAAEENGWQQAFEAVMAQLERVQNQRLMGDAYEADDEVDAADEDAEAQNRLALYAGRAV